MNIMSEAGGHELPSEMTLSTVVKRVEGLRSVLAYEADMLNMCLIIQSFPKRARVAAEALVTCLFRSSAGEVLWVFSPPNSVESAAYGEPISDVQHATNEVTDLMHAASTAASVINGFLSFKTYPRSRRFETAAQVDRLREVGDGRLELAYASVPPARRRRALSIAGAQERLTVESWWSERSAWTELHAARQSSGCSVQPTHR